MKLWQGGGVEAEATPVAEEEAEEEAAEGVAEGAATVGGAGVLIEIVGQVKVKGNKEKKKVLGH